MEHTINASIALKQDRQEDGVIVYKDSSDLFYFAFTEGNLVEGPKGGLRGFQKLMIYPQIILCERTIANDTNNAVFLRKKQKWLPSPGKSVEADWFGEIVVLNDDCIQIISGIDKDHKNHPIYLFEQECFVPEYNTENRVGTYQRCGAVSVFRTESCLILTSGSITESHPDTVIYLIEEAEFVEIPKPAKYNSPGMLKRFHFITDKYCVLKYGESWDPEFFVYEFASREYISFADILGKNERMLQVLCTADYFAFSYHKHSEHKDELVWKVCDASNWEEVALVFKTEITSDYFDSVKVVAGKLVIEKTVSKVEEKTI